MHWSNQIFLVVGSFFFKSSRFFIAEVEGFLKKRRGDGQQTTITIIMGEILWLLFFSSERGRGLGFFGLGD
ncbi:hypothetical protein B0T24DRAFT_188272 [Lasiosphaeria ovina]|uniref:Uncharacterized protein n=1 Tax=Lasiosphaeria ovina TaxID=92902 RepID=A0AAE0NEZ6_9PEZI|nr:hypothetical protein B0T24DRAFT_188272 [Lasiosphaeria ovina]